MVATSPIVLLMFCPHNKYIVCVTRFQQGHFVKEAALRSRLLTIVAIGEQNSDKSTYRNSNIVTN